MYSEFNDYIKKNRVPEIIAHETVISYLSDLRNKLRQYKSDLIREFNNKRSEIEKLINNSTSITELSIFMETMFSSVLSYVLHDKNNIYTMLEDKRALFE